MRLVVGLFVLCLWLTVDASRSESWRSWGQLTSGRSGLAAVFVERSDELFVVGGVDSGGPVGTFQSSKTAAARWRWLPELPTPRSGLAAVYFAPTDEIVAVGGLDADGNVLDTVELYSLATNSWRRGAPLPTPRQLFSLVAVGPLLYAVGGWNPDKGSLKSVEVYDPVADEWSQRRDLLYGVTAAAGAVVGGDVYIMGGYQYTQPSYSARVQMLPANGTGRWTAVASMPAPRAFFAAAVVNATVVAIGGQYDTALSTVVAYNTTSATWTTDLPSLQSPRLELAAAASHRRLFAIGGRDQSYLSSIEEFFLF